MLRSTLKLSSLHWLLFSLQDNPRLFSFKTGRIQSVQSKLLVLALPECNPLFTATILQYLLPDTSSRN